MEAERCGKRCVKIDVHVPALSSPALCAAALRVGEALSRCAAASASTSAASAAAAASTAALAAALRRYLRVRRTGRADPRREERHGQQRRPEARAAHDPVGGCSANCRGSRTDVSPRTGPGPAPAAPRPCRRGELPARARPCGPVRGRAPRFLVDSVRGGAPSARCTDHPRLRVDRRAPGVPGPPGRSSGDVGGGAAVVELLARVWAAERPHMIVLNAARPRERRRRSPVPVADGLPPRLPQQRCRARGGCGRAGRHSRTRGMPAAQRSPDNPARPCAAAGRRSRARISARCVLCR